MQITTGTEWVLLLAMPTFTAVHEDAGGDGCICSAGGDGCSLLLSRSILEELWWAAGEAANTLKPWINTSPLPIDFVLPAAIGVCIPGVWAKRGSPIPGKHCGSTKHDASSHAHHPCCESSRNL